MGNLRPILRVGWFKDLEVVRCDFAWTGAHVPQLLRCKVWRDFQGSAMSSLLLRQRHVCRHFTPSSQQCHVLSLLPHCRQHHVLPRHHG